MFFAPEVGSYLSGVKWMNAYSGLEIFIKLCSWLLSVCHVVLVLHDQAPDLNLIRLIQTAEMLKEPDFN